MNTRRLLQSLFAVATLMLVTIASSGIANAQTIYVDSSGGSDAACNGTSPNVATIPDCPKQTMGAALAAVGGGGTIEVAAGNYPGGPYTFSNSGLTVQARNVGANTDVFLTGGGVVVTANVTFASVGGAFYPDGTLTLTSGTVTIDAAGTYNHPAGGLITRTNGNIDGGAGPTFVGGASLLYNASSFDINQVAGNEVRPGSLLGGTLTVSTTSGGTPTLTFPNSFTAGVTTIGPNTADVTFTGTLTATSVTVSDANTHSFGGISLTGGDYTQSGGAAVTVGDLDTNGNRILHTAGTFSSTGTVSNNSPGSNDGTAGDGGAAAWIVFTGSTMTLNNIDLSGATNNDGVGDTFIQSVHNASGTGALTIGGTITEGATVDGAGANPTDFNWMEIINEAGSTLYTVSQANSISGDVDNDAGVPGTFGLLFSSGGTLNGDVDNSGTLWIGSGTLDLTSDAASWTEINDVNGSGKLLLSGDADVTALGITTDGDLELAGDNDGLGGAPLSVSGELTVSGTGDWATAGGTLTISGGNVLLSGTLGGAGLSAGNTLVVSAGNLTVGSSAVGDLLAAITVSGDMDVNSGSDLDGPLSVGGHLTVLGNADLGDGDADTFAIGGDLIVGNDVAMPAITISGPGNTASIVGGTMFINAGATVSGVDDENHTLTVDGVNIHEQTGGGPPNGTFYLGDDNTLVVQGSFIAGTFIGTDSDAPDDGDHALLAFVLDDNTTFAPGPNTQLCDFSAFGNEETLFVNTSFEVQCDTYVLDDTTLDLTDVLMRMTGADATLNISTDASVSGDPTKGAVSFEGTDVDLDGFIATIAPEAASVGHITSFIVNDPVGFGDVTTSGDLEVNGIMSLAFGGFTTGANTITWTGPDAGIIINTDGTGADITLSAGGAMAGSWDATWNGTNTVMGGTPGVELDPTKNNDLNVNTTVATLMDVPPGGAGGSISISGDFTVGLGTVAPIPGAIATIVDPLTVGGNGTIVGTVAAGGSGVTFTSASPQAHQVWGTFAAPATYATDATLFGNGTGTHTGTVMVGGDLTVTSFQSFQALITIMDGANFSVGFTDNDALAASVVGRDATVNGVSILGSGTWTSTTYASQVGGTTFDVGDGTDVAGFDMGGNTFDLYGGSTFSADFDANIAAGGTLRSAGGANSVNTHVGGSGDPADVTNFTNNSGTTTVPAGGGLEVTTLSDINATLGGPGIFVVSGTVNMGATIGAPTFILGTTVNVEGSQTFGSSLTINSSGGSVLFDSGAAGHAQVSLDIDGTYTQTAGDVTYDDVHMIIDGAFSYFAGDYTAGDADDEFHFRGGPGFTTNSAVVTFPTVRVSGGTTVMGTLGSSNDAMVVEDLFFLNSSLQVGSSFGSPCYPADLTIGGSGAHTVWAIGGNVNRACGSVTHTDPSQLKLAYGGFGTVTGTTNDEMPTSGSIGELETNGPGGRVTLDRTPTTDMLDLNAGGFDGGPNTVNIADGGTVFMGMAPASALDFPLTFDGDWTLDFEVGGFAVTGNEWPAAAVPTLFTTTHAAGTTSMSAPLRTAHDVTVGAGSFVDLLCVGLNVTGDLTSPGNVISTCGAPTPPGTLTFNGTGQQNTFGPVTLPQVALDNHDGLLLNGGNLSVINAGGLPLPAGTPPANLHLEDGAIYTGGNMVVIEHRGTGGQGFTRGTGAVIGTVSKQIRGGTAPMPADVMTYPTGAESGLAKSGAAHVLYRPGEITLNDPSQVSGVPASGLFIMMSHESANPAGKNNMPLDTFRDKESTDAPEDPAILPLRIARYAPFYWQVTTSANLSPSVSYDVQFDGGVYPEFEDENVERMRLIRRQDGNDENFWLLLSDVIADNDNFSVSPTQPVGVVRNAKGALIGTPGTRFTMGLESNMDVLPKQTLTMNIGGTIVIDLTTHFSGGTPLLAGPATYAYTPDLSGAAGVLTASIVGDILTISGVGVSETGVDISVAAVDELNDSRLKELTVVVNPAFIAGSIADAELNVGGVASTYQVDLLGVFSGGTPPVGYAVTNDNPGAATAVVAGNTLTVTAVAPGTANIGVTGTDSFGDTATSNFSVDVNAALAGSPIAPVALKEDDAATTLDLSAVFSGGDGDYVYGVSTDAAHINASESGGTLSASVVTAFAAGTTIGTVDVDVTATDGLGDSAMATLTIDVFPATGNVLGTPGPSVLDAQYILDFSVGLDPLGITAKQIGAADMNGDGSTTHFDAALNFIAALGGKSEVMAVVASYLEFGEVVQDGEFVQIPLHVVGGDLAEVVSAGFEAQLDVEAIAVQGVESHVEGDWMISHSVSDDGLLRVGMAGLAEIGSDGKVATIKLQLLDRGSSFNLAANGSVNDNETSSIDEVEIVELPETFALHGNYPNPFNPSTTIQFDLPETADVEIQIYDMLGRRAMVIPAQSIEAGVNRSVQLNASMLASGSYFYRVIARMDSKTLVESGRMMLVK